MDHFCTRTLESSELAGIALGFGSGNFSVDSAHFGRTTGGLFARVGGKDKRRRHSDRSRKRCSDAPGAEVHWFSPM
jgi:hypothetical protein